MTLNLEMVNEKRIDGDGVVFHFCKTQLKNNIFKKNINMKVKEMPLSQCPSGGFENYWG